MAQLEFVWCFSHDPTGIKCFREKSHEASAVLSHHIKDTNRHPDMAVDASLDYLVEGEFINFLHCYSSTPSLSVLFEKSHYA